MKRKVMIGLGLIVVGLVTYEFLIKAPPDGRDLRLAVLENDALKVRYLLLRGVDANAGNALRRAILEENVEIVQLLLDKGANVNLAPASANPSTYFHTPMEAAILQGNVKIVKMLLAGRIDVNTTFPCGQTPLGYAAQRGDIEVIRALLMAGADVNAEDEMNKSTALLYASRPEIVHLLLDKGADVNATTENGMTALRATLLHNRNIEVARALLERGAKVDNPDHVGATDLMWICRYGHTQRHPQRTDWVLSDAVQLLVENGADVNARDNGGATALLLASNSPDHKVVEILLKEGADVNAKYREHGARWGESQGWFDDIFSRHHDTALMRASRNGHTEVVQTLLEHGADVNAKDKKGRTALLGAVSNRRSEVVAALLDRGAGDADTEKNTALIAASLRGDAEAIRSLVSQGANVNASSITDGLSALMFACISGHVEAVQTLIVEGADVETDGGTLLAWARTTERLSNHERKIVVDMLKDAGAKEE